MTSVFKVAVAIVVLANTGIFLAAQSPKLAQHGSSKKTAAPSIETQIQQMRQELQSQIDDLKTRLAARDAQIEAMQLATQATQDKTATVTTQIQAANVASQRNGAAIDGIRSSIDGLQAADTTLVTKVEQTQKTADDIRKSVDEPAALHYKGITIVPGGFLAAEVSGVNGR